MSTIKKNTRDLKDQKPTKSSHLGDALLENNDRTERVPEEDLAVTATNERIPENEETASGERTNA